MKVAVLTLTRDRLLYSQHCFQTLRENAGCEFDHFVLDQGSTDGTREWLEDQFWDGYIDEMCFEPENIGIPKGMNTLLALALDRAYDVIVKFDNDCELLQPNTLWNLAYLALTGDAILSPRILGLLQPPAAQDAFNINDEPILDIPQIGGIFMAVPAYIYTDLGFRYDERYLLFDDEQLCWWWRGQGGRCGYVAGIEANHYETTAGQQQRYPAYFERKAQEFASAR